MKSSLLLVSIFPFLVAAQQLYDVVINEVMADASPAVSLPAVEWIEIKNRTSLPVNLQGWRIATSTALSGAFPAYSLPAGGIAIVCAAASVSQLQSYGTTISVSNFPALDNDGTTLSLLRDTRVVHAIKYKKDWYRNALKQEGGWSLEMINSAYPCSNRSNWNAALSPTGGTPGTGNSQTDTYDDITPPLLTNVTSESDSILLIHFNEPLDTNGISDLQAYNLHGSTIIKAEIIAPVFDMIRLTTAHMSPGSIYSLSVSTLRDCAGNNILPVSARAGMPGSAEPGDIIFNEILFNPSSGGHDFIELYNRSERIFNLAQLSIARRAADGSIQTPSRLINSDSYLFPGDYVALTENKTVIINQYMPPANSWIETASSLPSLPDDEGHIVLLNESGNVIDELFYSERWHFSLIADPQGVSLEKIAPGMPATDPTSWHSAASSVRYATPGYRNSQAVKDESASQVTELDSPVFSPDNDGSNDNCIIRYRLPEAGWVANVRIYNLHGVVVKNLINNQLAGTEGRWIWDGLDEDDNACPAGHYIVYCELFNATGKKKRKKMLVVLAKRL